MKNGSITISDTEMYYVSFGHGRKKADDFICGQARPIL